jgi:16S rRNA (adenine1518-N6/adenine1519-N6)-dimethyltransferase
MLNLTSPKVVTELLHRYNIKASKKFGQNFLIDRNIMNKITDAASLNPSDMVLEVGSGLGALTVELAKMAEKVLTFEIDKALAALLSETLSTHTNVDLIFGDILKQNLYELTNRYFGEKDFKVVANVPYYISTPIIMLFLESRLPLSRMVLLVQKEVAQRMVANPGSEEFGALSLAIQYRMSPRIEAIVPPTVFMPAPEVDSAIIVLERRTKPTVKVKDENLMFELIRAAFAQRRKRLPNALAAISPNGKTKTEILSILDNCDIDPKRRGETLTLEEFARIADMICE